MGYYENPPMVQPSRGSEIVSAAIANAASSVSQGIMVAGERKRQEEKERKLTIQKLQDKKNETDLYYNEKLSDWKLKESTVNDAVDAKVYDMVQQKITLAADSRIALLNETDPKIRQQYLDNIRKANVFMDSSANFAKSIAGQTATWRLDTKGIKVGEVGGHVIDGKTDKEILDNTAAVEILGGMTSLYTDTNIDITEDENGEGLMLKVTGKHNDGSAFDVMIDSKKFAKSEAEGDSGLLLPVESLDTFYTKAKEDVVDKKGEVYEGYLNPKTETVDVPSGGDSGGGVGGDVFQIRARRLQEKAIRAAIDQKSEVTAVGMLSADSPSRLRTMLNYTLKQPIGFYDEEFKNKTPEEQKSILKSLLTNKSFENMTRDFRKTKDENGNTIYWNPSGDVTLKDKTSEAELRANAKATLGEDGGKPEPTTYKTDYFNEIIQGYVPKQGEKVSTGQVNYRTRASLVSNLNKLSGSNSKYLTREEVFKRYQNSPYKEGKYDTGKTMQEAYDAGDIKGDIKSAFNKVVGAGEILTKEGTGYKSVKGYNVNSAVDRVKLALDQTSNAGEIKMLQGKLEDAKLMDWVKKNPMKKGESQEQYAKRASKQ
jgi:hypothetical protein